MADNPSTLECICLAGQIDPLSCDDVSAFTTLRVTAELKGAGTTPVTDPTNCAIIPPNKEEVTLENVTDGCWSIGPLKPNTNADPNLALQPSGTYYEIRVFGSTTGVDGPFTLLLGPVDVTIDGSADYFTGAPDCCSVDVNGDTCVNIVCVLPPAATVPATDVFCTAVRSCVGGVSDSGIANVTGDIENGFVVDVQCADVVGCIGDISGTGLLAGNVTGDTASGWAINLACTDIVGCIGDLSGTGLLAGKVTGDTAGGWAIDLQCSDIFGCLGDITGTGLLAGKVTGSYLDGWEVNLECADIAACIPAFTETALVVTTDGDTDGVDQSGTSDHTLDITLRSANTGQLLGTGTDGGLLLTCADILGCINIQWSATATAPADGADIEGTGTAADPFILPLYPAGGTLDTDSQTFVLTAGSTHTVDLLLPDGSTLTAGTAVPANTVIIYENNLAGTLIRQEAFETGAPSVTTAVDNNDGTATITNPDGSEVCVQTCTAGETVARDDFVGRIAPNVAQVVNAAGNDTATQTGTYDYRVIPGTLDAVGAVPAISTDGMFTVTPDGTECDWSFDYEIYLDGVATGETATVSGQLTAGTEIFGPQLIADPTFDNPNTAADPGGAIGGGWTASVPYAGLDAYPLDTTVSVVVGAISDNSRGNSGIVRQVTFPGDVANGVPAANNWLYSNGNTTGAPYISAQTPVTVVAGETYEVFAYTSSALASFFSAADKSILQFQLDGNDIGPGFTEFDHPDAAGGDMSVDLWHRRAFQFTATTSGTFMLSLLNNALGSVGNDLALTAVSMRSIEVC